jgi:hypothetical protein
VKSPVGPGLGDFGGGASCTALVLTIFCLCPPSPLPSFYPGGALPGEYNGSFPAARCPITVPACGHVAGKVLFSSTEQVSAD